MIRYKVNAKREKSFQRCTIALTDFADVAELIKITVEREHPDFKVSVQDLSSSPVLFNTNERAFDDSGKEGNA